MKMTVRNERTEQKLWEILPEFSIEGTPRELVRICRGNIHDSYVSIWKSNGTRYLHQWVNQTVFPDIEGLMSNIALVTSHIQGRLDQGFRENGERTLRLIPARTGKIGVRDEEGGYWRTYEFISDTRTIDVCDGPDHAREAARMFGRFVLHCLEIEPGNLCETIPNFQNTPFRYRQLEEAVQKDVMGRYSDVFGEVEFARSRQLLGSTLVEAVQSGALPRRVIHYDTKLNNILFDITEDRGVCVVDLDTVMPGTILYDFGDMVRNAAVPTTEDETDLSRVEMDLDLFKALVQGYLEGTEAFLEPSEVELLPMAPGVLALTLGIRFLTDYINGDRYFNIRYPDHNLLRCRTQFKIVRSMERQGREMRAAVRSLTR